MARQTTIITPENIPLTLELAGLGSRFGALLIDLIIQGCLVIVVVILLGILSAMGISLDVLEEGNNVGDSLGSIAVAVVLVLMFLILFGYFILFETIWNGQTPGKRMFNLRVVRDGGYPISFGSTAARNLLRIADFLPVSYAAGALTMFFHPQYKRLGDLVGGTVVIKERQGINLPSFRKKETGNAGIVTLPEGTQNPYDVLNSDELELLRRFASRRWEMSSDDSERLAYRLVAPLVPRLNITFQAGAPPRYADLASALVTVANERETELAAR